MCSMGETGYDKCGFWTAFVPSTHARYCESDSLKKVIWSFGCEIVIRVQKGGTKFCSGLSNNPEILLEVKIRPAQSKSMYKDNFSCQPPSTKVQPRFSIRVVCFLKAYADFFLRNPCPVEFDAGSFVCNSFASPTPAPMVWYLPWYGTHVVSSCKISAIRDFLVQSPLVNTPQPPPRNNTPSQGEGRETQLSTNPHKRKKNMAGGVGGTLNLDVQDTYMYIYIYI